MASQLLPLARWQLNRFCREYLQLQLHLDYPDENHLRNDAFQRCLYSSLFQENAVPHEPPQRYQLRVLKELTKRIEQSIQDWEEEVCGFLRLLAPLDSLLEYISSLSCHKSHLHPSCSDSLFFPRESLMIS